MKIKLEKSWTFTLEPEEAALVLRALGSRLRGPEDVKAAKELGDKITLDRRQEAWSLAVEMDKHVKAMEGKNEG